MRSLDSSLETTAPLECLVDSDWSYLHVGRPLRMECALLVVAGPHEACSDTGERTKAS